MWELREPTDSKVAVTMWELREPREPMDPRNPRLAVSAWELMEPRVAVAVWEPIVMYQRDSTDLRVVITVWKLRNLRDPWEPMESRVPVAV